MEKLRSTFELSFSTKVIVPVVALMVMLMATTVWLLDHRVTQQFQQEATRSLAAAHSFFRGSQRTHAQELLLRYGNLPKEPRYRALFQKADPPTLQEMFKTDLLSEQKVDLVLYTNERGDVVASAQRDSLVSMPEFEAKAGGTLKRARQQEATTDMVELGGRLFEVVSVPVLISPENPIGVLTFGLEFGKTAAEELRDIAQCQVVLLASGQVVASTKAAPEFTREFVRLFKENAHSEKEPDFSNIKGIVLGDEHYFCSAGRFETSSAKNGPGYLLLLSYEKRLAALHATQQTLLEMSALGTLLGAVVIWLLVRKLTKPLRALRDSAEAVGKGDYTQRVTVTSRDECGELANVFNQMTENVARSREQLETTVQTLRTTQAQLIQSEKLSGIGEFVAGVAHELNNPLTSVMGFSELLEKMDRDPQHKRYLEMICKSAHRCHKIVQSLLSFARRRQPERKLSNLNELIESAADFLQYQMRTSNVEVITKLCPNLPKTMVDPHQVQQVFLNILNNARQAIEGHRPKGSIRVATEVCGQTVRVVLQDDGPGISEANLSKVFDPFFTTKEAGKGTGLGLSLCYGIVKDHGGTIHVQSKPGDGATFVIEFPIASEAADFVPEPESTEKGPETATVPQEGAGKKVLVIDDEETILQMVKDILTNQGYVVDVARDGETALRSMRQNAYDLALCDWKMPGLSGEQVYEQVVASIPAMSEKFIFFTGDVINDKAQQFLEARRRICLPKPFSLQEFRCAINKALATN